jgi:hypothetical protein
VDPSSGIALIDTELYDLDDARLSAACLEQFRAEGICVLPGFLRPETVASLVAESDELAHLAHRSATTATVYLAAPDPSLPADDLRATPMNSSVEVVGYDLFPPTSLLRSLYESDELLGFIGRCLGVDELHRYADPFGALNLAIMRDGDRLGWHFDMTDFVVSIAIQSSDSGGEFENAARIRSATEENIDGIAAVVAGEEPHRVRVELMTPGTLMIFNGRWSLHRVDPIIGDRPRYVALLAYDTKPGTDSTDTLKLARYGRLPAPASTDGSPSNTPKTQGARNCSGACRS